MWETGDVTVRVGHDGGAVRAMVLASSRRAGCALVV
jgi:hypothetical protein